MAHRGSELFHERLRRIGEMHDRKQVDYGSDADPFANLRNVEKAGLDPIIGVIIRMGDKMFRLQTAIAKATRSGTTGPEFRKRLQTVLANEGFEDSLTDIAVYAAIGLAMLDEEAEAEDLDDFSPG
jgi:hypothetical protein